MASSLDYNQIAALLLLLFAAAVMSHAPPGGNPMDSSHIHDKEHIKEHLDGVADKNTADMTNEELEFHYFKLHDYDNNNKLDGIEIVKAISHYNGESPSESKDAKSYSDKELEELVDSVLLEEDKNDDGYINYAEFREAQKKGYESATTEEKGP